MFGRSWRLMKATWGLLQADKELATFPLLSGIAVLIASICFGILALAIAMVNPDISRAITALTEGTRAQEIPPAALVAGVIILFFYYLVIAVITNYLMGALIGATLIRLRGGDPTLSDGFRIARSRLSDLFGFSVIAATVGLALSLFRSQARGGSKDNPVGAILGAIFAGILEMAWNIATFLVIPVIVDEKVGPFEAIKRSTAMLKKTFGEQIIGGAGLGFVMFLFSIVAFLLFGALAAIAGGLGFGLGVVLAIVLLFVALAVLGVIGSTLGGIYKAAVYYYAQTGEIPMGWEPEMVTSAFKPKAKRGALFGA